MTICPKINVLDLDQAFLKIYEEKYHLKLQQVQRTLGTTIMNPGEPTNYFDEDIPIAVFIIDGVVMDIEGRVIEIEKSLYRGDKYKFSISAKPLLFDPTKNPIQP